jgi:outer membrane lipopolysaccharide assembly protein LptE/RlpB
MLITASSCGYRLSQFGSVIPQNARSLTVLAFMNMTNEPAVDVEVTNAVVKEFLADGRMQVTDREEADLVLRGSVVSYQEVPLSYTADSYVQQYSILIRVEARLEDRSGKIIWREKELASGLISSFAVTLGDISATRSARENALRKASRDIAWTIRSRILEGF